MTEQAHCPGEPRPVHVADRAGRVLGIDAGALRISTPGEADRWIPLRHVSRIVVGSACRLDWDLVLACARRSIPVVVREDDARVVLRVVGVGKSDTGLRQRLLDLTADMTWTERLLDWHRAQQRRIDGIVARRLRVPGSHHHAAGLDRWLNEHACRWAGPIEARRSARILRLLCLTRIQEALLAHGLDGGSEALLNDEIDLLALLTDLLARQLEPVRMGILRRRAESGVAGRLPPAMTERQWIDRYERHRGRMERTVNDLLNRLHRWLVEIA